MFSHSQLLSLVVGIPFIMQVDAQGLDPVKNMCIRIDHQSTIKNNTLYIDGGTQTFVDDNNSGQALGSITVGYNKYLIAVDMSKSWDWKQANFTESIINKSANSRTGTYPPVAVRGALYQGAYADTRLYQYGGTTSYLNTSFPGFQFWSYTDQYSLWSYDIVTGEWDQYDITNASPERPSSGAYTEAPDQGLAFYLNGQIDNGSSSATASFEGNVEVSLNGMIVIDTNLQTARNLSTYQLDGNSPRTRARLQYLPGIGTRGILISVGGSSKSAADVNNEEIGTLLPMDTIDIFDIASMFGSSDGTWFKQSATGDIPEPRVDHCLVVASAPDKSSHNIYMYGGRSSSTKIYDEIYVLSVPSFIWTKIFAGISPRWGMTCHFVGNRQMITVGGYASTDLTIGCDWETKGVAIYDMSTLTWGSVFNYSSPPYTVPDIVVANIGGLANGSANTTMPKGGWTNSALAQLFRYSPLTNATNPLPSSVPSKHPTSGPKHLSRGSLAGIMIGSISGAILMLIFAICLYQRTLKGGAREDTIADDIGVSKQEPGPEKLGLFVFGHSPPIEGWNLDIVAVHGLGGHWEDTWKAENGKLWLRDFLPLLLPNARIMSYGYDSSTAFSNSITDISNAAMNLLNRLEDEREQPEEKTRPIIFVSHSLGGIVVKKTLILAHEQSRHKNLLDSVRGCMFFGVPHHGTNIAYWGDIAAKLLKIGTLGSANPKFVAALKSNSSTLHEISRQFPERVASIKIRTFYETKKLRNQLIVDERSARLNHHNEIAVGIEGADHRSMCNFSHASGQKYKPVAKAIKQLADYAVAEQNLPRP